jgi:hypothetical protein
MSCLKAIHKLLNVNVSRNCNPSHTTWTDLNHSNLHQQLRFAGWSTLAISLGTNMMRNCGKIFGKFQSQSCMKYPPAVFKVLPMLKCLNSLFHGCDSLVLEPSRASPAL